MEHIRKASLQDVSRLAEILIFAKRAAYRPIFQNDAVSFGQMQVLPLAQEYLRCPEKLKNIWVYDDEFVKGMVHIQGLQIKELYVDYFFQHQGIGAQLLDFAVRDRGARFLWVLEKNKAAIQFYGAHGFVFSGQRMLEAGTPEFLQKMGWLAER